MPWEFFKVCIGGWQQVWYHFTFTYVTVFGQPAVPAVRASLKYSSAFFTIYRTREHDTSAASFSSFKVATDHMQCFN